MSANVSLKDLTLARLREFQISPKRSLGQNFLVSETVVEKTVAAVLQFAPKTVVEVGPGLGALTEDLLKNKSRYENFFLVELDRKFAEYWKGRGLNVFECDALDFDWSKIETEFTLVSNLPYQISSRLVVEQSTAPVSAKNMVLMFQKEVAERISAKPGGKEYGLLSVIAQCYWKIDTVTNAGSQDFYPAPQVGSRVLKFATKKPQLDARLVKNADSFLSFVKAAFSQRRKQVVKNLVGYEASLNWPDILTQLGLRVDARAEMLTVDNFVELFFHTLGK